MSAPDRKVFFLRNPAARANALYAVSQAPEGWGVTVRPQSRSLDQGAMFHAICGDIAKSGFRWDGCERTAEEWKCLLIAAHAVATGRPADVVPNLEDGSPVQLRESTAAMSKARATSLIDYCIAWATANGIKLRDVAR